MTGFSSIILKDSALFFYLAENNSNSAVSNGKLIR